MFCPLTVLPDFVFFVYSYFQFKTRMRKTGSRENRDSEAIHYGNVEKLFCYNSCKDTIPYIVLNDLFM